MSVYVNQSITRKIVQDNIPAELDPHSGNPSTWVDFDAVYGVVTVAIIWGCFVASFWLL